jgi:hypothetical protein
MYHPLEHTKNLFSLPTECICVFRSINRLGFVAEMQCVFRVRYELNSYMSRGSNSVFKGLICRSNTTHVGVPWLVT